MTTTSRNARRMSHLQMTENAYNVSPRTEQVAAPQLEQLSPLESLDLATRPYNNLDFRPLAMNAPAAENATVEQLRQTVHGLVKAGLANEEHLNGLSLRVLNFSDGQSKPYVRDALGVALEPEMAQMEAELAGGNPIPGNFYREQSYGHAISIDGKAAEEMMRRSGGTFTQDEALTALLMHEHGHAAHSRFDIAKSFVEQSKNDVTSGVPQGMRSAAIEALTNEDLARYRRAFDGHDLGTVAMEQHADVYMLMGTQALKGEAEATRLAQAFIQVRNFGEHEQLSLLGPESTLVHTHNTTTAVQAFLEAQKSGEVQKALDSGQGLALIDKIAYGAYMDNVADKYVASLNVHRLNDEGVPQYGIPESVTRGQLLQAMESGELPSVGSGYTLLMDKGNTQALAQEGVHLIPGGTRANPDIAGNVKQTNELASLPNYEALSTSSFELTVRDDKQGAASTFVFGSPTENFLEAQGWSTRKAGQVEQSGAHLEQYYQSLHQRAAQLPVAQRDAYYAQFSTPAPTEEMCEREVGRQALVKAAPSLEATLQGFQAPHGFISKACEEGTLPPAQVGSSAAGVLPDSGIPASKQVEKEVVAEMELGD